jgi:hypothetical protein
MIDNTLTLERAVELIGGPIRIRRQPHIEERAEIDNFYFTHNTPLFYFEWVFTSESAAMKEWKTYQEARRVGRYKDLQTIAQANCGVCAVVNEYALVKDKKVFTEITDGDGYNKIVEEMYLNEFEHGSKFGRDGAVHITIQGGKSGIVTVVKGPGSGYELRQITKEELKRRRESVKTLYQMESWAPRIPPRGCGLPKYSISETAIVNAEMRDDGFYTFAPYLLREHRQL